MTKNSFHKAEKLKSRKSIEELFRSGRSIASPPFRLLYRKVEDQMVPIKMTVAVPKKLVKRAVDRNLLKRRTREAYRLAKAPVVSAVRSRNTAYEILFLFQTSEIVEYKTIKNSVNFLLQKFTSSL